MQARFVAVGVLAAALGLRLVPVPTGMLGQKVLRWLTPPESPFVLEAKSVAWRFPLGARLDSVRIRSGLEIRTPRLGIEFSPWALLTGDLRIARLEAGSLLVRTEASARPLVATVAALDSVPLGGWFPQDVLPSEIAFEALTVRTPEGTLLLSARDFRMDRDGQDLSLGADSLGLFGILQGGELLAKGRLPFALESLSLALAGGSLEGRAVPRDKALHLDLRLSTDLAALRTGWDSASVSGRLRADSLGVTIPFDADALEMDGALIADSVALRAWSYARDPWVRAFVPELGRVGLGKVKVVPAGIEKGKIRIASISSVGDTLKLEAKGWLGLDGRLQLQARVGLVERYAATRPALLRAALQPGEGGFRTTSTKISGSLSAMKLAPTAEAVAEAASNPFHALGELFR